MTWLLNQPSKKEQPSSHSRIAVPFLGAEPNPFPQPWWALFWGSIVAFVLSVVCALPVVLVYRFVGRIWKRRHVVYDCHKN